MGFENRKKNIDGISYMVFDPSKNITALVNTDVSEPTISLIAKKIMDKEPKVEQVGFLYYENDSDISLRMAGGEFCGNATMCAAIYYAIKNDLIKSEVRVKVFGIKEHINVKVVNINVNEWEGTVEMPKEDKMMNIRFSKEDSYPVVFFPSIAHIIIDSKTNCKYEKADFEYKIKEWCNTLNVKALGIMQYDSKICSIKPLVYVKSIDTLFWENACASGTTAVGLWLLNEKHEKIDIDVVQPSGDILKVFSDENSSVMLKGKVRVDI